MKIKNAVKLNFIFKKEKEINAYLFVQMGFYRAFYSTVSHFFTLADCLFTFERPLSMLTVFDQRRRIYLVSV